MGTTNLDSLELSGTLTTTGATTQTGIVTLQTAHSGLEYHIMCTTTTTNRTES